VGERTPDRRQGSAREGYLAERRRWATTTTTGVTTTSKAIVMNNNHAKSPSNAGSASTATNGFATAELIPPQSNASASSASERSGIERDRGDRKKGTTRARALK